ncbi:MAG: ATP phosphoribosyltransferase [Phycisphaerales bacterium]|nr:ATP phosphoribosyltransferase [Phycisphaerales bacterium]
MADTPIKLTLPKGRQQGEVLDLLAEAGLRIRAGAQEYRPTCSDARFEVKLLKAANIPKLVEYGAHDVGITGRDWIEETSADVVELLDTGLLPVRVVSAAPIGSNPFTKPGNGPLIVASEYENLTRRYMEGKNQPFRYVRTYGATEVFPPEDADLIVDNTASGATLRSNGLAILDEILPSSSRVVANRATLDDPARRDAIEELVLLVASVLDGRKRVLLDMNVTADRLEAVIDLLPAMKSPTIQPLYKDRGYAVRVAVLRNEVHRILPAIRKAGATDILQTSIQKVIA